MEEFTSWSLSYSICVAACIWNFQFRVMVSSTPKYRYGSMSGCRNLGWSPLSVTPDNLERNMVSMDRDRGLLVPSTSA